MGVLDQARLDALANGTHQMTSLRGGKAMCIADGYIPLLTNFTLEDKAAKGLRKGKTRIDSRPTIPFTAVEIVRDVPFLLLEGPLGAGKTTFAKYLSWALASEDIRRPQAILRNSLGDTRKQVWDESVPAVVFLSLETHINTMSRASHAIATLIASWLETRNCEAKKELLVILDGIDATFSGFPDSIWKFSDDIRKVEGLRLLLLGQQGATEAWVLPDYMRRHRLQPLQTFQRRQFLAEKRLDSFPRTEFPGCGPAASNPAVFSLCLASGDAGHTAESAVDAWLIHTHPDPKSRVSLVTKAYEQYIQEQRHEYYLREPYTAQITRDLIVARHLATEPIETAIELFQKDPVRMKPAVSSLLRRVGDSPNRRALINQLLLGPEVSAQQAALLVSEVLTDIDVSRELIQQHVLGIIQSSSVRVPDRVAAGRVLSRFGDPRDLMELVTVPGGSFVMGSASTPNSSPRHTVHLESFRIGTFPVVNSEYLRFIEASGRYWSSVGKDDRECGNFPATDLTWHDAKAYCSWLTGVWRSSGKISAQEEVDLPSEPQWEKACRGDQDIGTDGISEDRTDICYPWGHSWVANASNCESLGLNETCSVGLFPEGRSPNGCQDMTGQVWEWCTTLWGPDMTTPSYRYPWRNDDGREPASSDEVDGSIRRVLRGGCFSSGPLRANCSYRGSLEPAGLWRGNGFRIVVNRVAR
jgi:gamma-glutamyl hercynylcysteine S-oxide synthase